MVRALLLALCCAFFASHAEARSHRAAFAPECNVIMPCDLSYSAPVAQKRVHIVQRSASRLQKSAHVVRRVRVVASTRSQVVEHPVGCPRIAFCGCGAAVRIFGKAVRSLWLAANWFHFPRASPAPGMVAVTRHHVFVLESHVEGNQWLTYDANSGGHLTRVHVRSIAGYTIVNPHSG